MDWTKIDWKALDRLRRAFLDGTAGTLDYWRSEGDLASYDATFAQRIGWKWDYVLSELRRRGWTPPKDVLLDWGCGTGIAGRAFLDHFGVEAVTSLALSDRSPLAVSYASRAAQSKYPQLDFSLGIPARPGTLLLSHVLTELTPEQIEELLKLVETATTIVWVEPGTYEASLTLIAIREWLRSRVHVVAPCTHTARCGIQAPSRTAFGGQTGRRRRRRSQDERSACISGLCSDLSCEYAGRAESRRGESKPGGTCLAQPSSWGKLSAG